MSDLSAVQTVLLLCIVLLTLFLPFMWKKVEENLEAFLFVMGLGAATISHAWSTHLVKDALLEPLPITATVAGVGILFYFTRKWVKKGLDFLQNTLGRGGMFFAIVFILGMASSLTTAIVAALILSEVMTQLSFERKSEIRLAILACFAIGLGAALTPIGEPLSTILVSKLKEPPHNADFFYVLRMMGLWIIPGVIACSGLAAWQAGSAKLDTDSLEETEAEGPKDILVRAGKVYLFVMALTFLGKGLTPMAEKYLLTLPSSVLYWVNSISAILDNATLVAAEVSPQMTDVQIKYIVLGLVLSGGMLIPGNIPNIISASKLNIKAKEWARFGAPFGAVLMLIYFILLLIFVR
jgi:predicted cation transporter